VNPKGNGKGERGGPQRGGPVPHVAPPGMWMNEGYVAMPLRRCRRGSVMPGAVAAGIPGPNGVGSRGY
jgi:hypothetical protein